MVTSACRGLHAGARLTSRSRLVTSACRDLHAGARLTSHSRVVTSGCRDLHARARLTSHSRVVTSGCRDLHARARLMSRSRVVAHCRNDTDNNDGVATNVIVNSAGLNDSICVPVLMKFDVTKTSSRCRGTASPSAASHAVYAP